MKDRTILLFLAMCFARQTFAQYPPQWIPRPATKLEIFAARTNAVLTTENYFVHAISGDNGCRVRFQAIIMYEPGQEAQKIRGMKVDIVELRQNKDERSVTLYVDFEELEPLSRAITTMLDVTQRGTALPNPIAKEVSFTTTGGLTLAMVQRNRERQLLLTHSLQPDIVCAVSQGRTITDLKTAIETAIQDIR
jgi:hypothetical protein